MTPEQITTIKTSFAKAFYKKEEVGKRFYQRLFEIAPETRLLFKGDIDLQGRKLMDTLAVAVSALRDAPLLNKTLHELGARHRAYGVTARHYAPVGEALIWTLEETLGPDFDAKSRAAWLQLYLTVAAAMEPTISPAPRAA